MATNMLPTIEKLEGRNNYSTWKTRLYLMKTREDIEQLNATRIQTEIFKRKGNERDDDATMTAMSA
jgi:hypothetical protein